MAVTESFENVSLEAALKGFAKTLKTSGASEERRGNEGADTLFKLLKEKIDVDRAVVVGSIICNESQTTSDPNENNEEINNNEETASRMLENTGLTGTKTTSAANINNYPHFDVVIFVNDTEPPFTSTLREFALIFLNVGNVDVVNAQYNSFIGVVFDGCRYDIFPATNYATGIHEFGRSQSQDQYKKAVQKINESDSPAQSGRLYSSALAEAAQEFTTQQSKSDFVVQSVIALGKHWMSQINTDNYCIIRRSYIVECIAIHAADTTASTNESILEAFRKFLQLITNFYTLKIYLKNVPIPDCYQNNRYKGPVLVDPVNPYNNLAVFLNDPVKQEQVIRIFETAAMTSLWKLDHLENQNRRNPVRSIDDISNIFLQIGSNSKSSSSRPRRRSMSVLGWLVFILFFVIVLVSKWIRYAYRKFGWYSVGVAIFLGLYLASQLMK